MVPKSGNRISEKIVLQRNSNVAHNMDAAHRAAWEGKIVASPRPQQRPARVGILFFKMLCIAKTLLAGTRPAITRQRIRRGYFHSTFMTS